MTSNIEYHVDNVVRQIAVKFNPSKIILFGSVANGMYSSNSDIDLCIIKNSPDKRNLLTDIYTEVDCEILMF